MKGLKLSLLTISLGFIMACGNEHVSDDENEMNDVMTTTSHDNTENTSGSSIVTVADASDSLAYLSEQGRNSDDSLTPREIRKGVKETGQYNSNIDRPAPPNTDRMQGVPTHSYGDTADRADGVNGVR